MLRKSRAPLLNAWFSLVLLVVSPAWAEPVDDFDTPAVVLAPVSSVAAAREELQQLLDGSLMIAARQLREQGTFYPFLAGLTDAGKIQVVGMPASEQRPQLDVMLQALRKAARQLTRQQRFRAVALYVDFMGVRRDAQIEQPGIRVELEHRFPDSLTVFVPYFITPDREIRLLTPQFMRGAHPYFFETP